MIALRKKYLTIFSSNQINIWVSKNEHFHLTIKIKNGEPEKNKLEEISEAANDVYEELSDVDSYFNFHYNPNIPEVTRDFLSIDFIVLHKDIC